MYTRILDLQKQFFDKLQNIDRNDATLEANAIILTDTFRRVRANIPRWFVIDANNLLQDINKLIIEYKRSSDRPPQHLYELKANQAELEELFIKIIRDEISQDPF